MTVVPFETPSRRAMKEAMERAKEPQQLTQHLKAVIYGKPKRGKTHFLGTLPKPLILDFDGGSGPLANRKKFPDFDGKIVEVTSWEDVEMWYWILATQKHEFESVAWDTVSMAAELKMKEILEGKMQKRSGDTDPYHANMQDYGRNNRYLRTWLPRYKNLPMNVVFVCHERAAEAPDEESGEDLVEWYVPDLQTGIRGFLLGMVNTIGYAYKVSREGKVSYRMAFDRPGTDASDRFGLLPRVMANPTYDKIMSYYRKGEES